MYSYKSYLLFIFLIWGNLEISGQENYSGPLKIGDHLPEFTLKNVINHSSNEIRTSDYNHKWIILDFWASWCSPCIAAFPKLEALQKKFNNDIQIIPVTYQNRSETEEFLERLKISRGIELDLPLVVADSLLHALFPHKELPYYVWINPEGKVIATTKGGDELTEDKIESLIKDKNFVPQSSMYVPVPFSKGDLLLLGNEKLQGKRLIYQSALLPFIDGLASGYTVFPENPIIGKRVLFTNSRLLSLFSFAHSSQDVYFGSNRTILEVEDLTKFKSPQGSDYKQWLEDGNSFNYELIIPNKIANHYHSYMKEDLKRYFPQYKATVEKRKIDCLVLRKSSDKDKIKTLGKDFQADHSPLHLKITNGFIVDLIARLNVYYLQLLPTPIIDETYYTGRIDINLLGNIGDLDSLREALKKYDLELIEAQREIDVLVIQDIIPDN